ncbi:uncharacterized protein LOC121798813 [Salvia splendens]|uniref:uncharacterized protein LOC121798813 n=1 Tax=Salvia splendens TaxID=180675 RepID=UPI001C25FEE9|nr:uncharacterized protein LOC121798813 [Salvia splendens]
MLPRGRGQRSQYPSFYKGRGGGIPIIQHGNKKLFRENITGIDQLEDNPELLQKVQEYLNSKKDSEGTSSSWANKVQGSTSYAEVITSSEEKEKYIPSPFKDIIIFLETHDLKWEKEPWKLMQRYMDTTSYAAPAYKKRIFYEEFLTSMGACEIRHFKTYKEAKVYNFSRIIIKQIITAEDWGFGTLRERECQIKNNNGGREVINFNYWDIKEAYYKTFFYQNPYHKHSWWIKICPKVYEQGLPTWIYDWWQTFGTSEKILPEEFKSLFFKWKHVSPALIEAENQNRFFHNMETLHFYAEFGIPWIWKWEPEIGFDHNNVPCLKRQFSTRFWPTMMEKDKSGDIQGLQTLQLIKERVSFYKEQKRVNKSLKKDITPFEEFLRKNISKMNEKELIAKYMASIGKDIDHMDEDENEEGDTDINSPELSPNNDEHKNFRDAQDPYEEEEGFSTEDNFENFIKMIEKTPDKANGSQQSGKMKE